MQPAPPTHSATRSEPPTSEWTNTDSFPADRILRDAFECKTSASHFPPSLPRSSGFVAQPDSSQLHSLATDERNECVQLFNAQAQQVWKLQPQLSTTSHPMYTVCVFMQTTFPANLLTVCHRSTADGKLLD